MVVLLTLARTRLSVACTARRPLVGYVPVIVGSLTARVAVAAAAGVVVVEIFRFVLMAKFSVDRSRSLTARVAVAAAAGVVVVEIFRSVIMAKFSVDRSRSLTARVAAAAAVALVVVEIVRVMMAKFFGARAERTHAVELQVKVNDFQPRGCQFSYFSDFILYIIVIHNKAHFGEVHFSEQQNRSLVRSENTTCLCWFSNKQWGTTLQPQTLIVPLFE